MNRWMAIKWYDDGMITTMDRAGRLVIPKTLRVEIGLVPGNVEIEVDGDALRIRPAEVLEFDDLEFQDGIATLPRAGTPLTDDDVRELRLADQR